MVADSNCLILVCFLRKMVASNNDDSSRVLIIDLLLSRCDLYYSQLEMEVIGTIPDNDDGGGCMAAANCDIQIII